jgi:hypothetical protein
MLKLSWQAARRRLSQIHAAIKPGPMMAYGEYQHYMYATELPGPCPSVSYPVCLSLSDGSMCACVRMCVCCGVVCVRAYVVVVWCGQGGSSAVPSALGMQSGRFSRSSLGRESQTIARKNCRGTTGVCSSERWRRWRGRLVRDRVGGRVCVCPTNATTAIVLAI